LIATDQGFFPSTVFVTQGIPVRLFVTGASAKSQCFIMDAFGVRRQIKSQKLEEISFVPETAGTYVFTCPMNGARGAVVVKELDVGSRVPAAAEVSQAP
jgi:plastocyanin domain-containing protein